MSTKWGGYATVYDHYRQLYQKHAFDVDEFRKNLVSLIMDKKIIRRCKNGFIKRYQQKLIEYYTFNYIKLEKYINFTNLICCSYNKFSKNFSL